MGILGALRRPVPSTPTPRPGPDDARRCTGLAQTTGQRCTRWTVAAGAAHCHIHTPRSAPADPPPAPPHSPWALSASVANVQMEGVGWQTWRPGTRDWQREAWRQYDICGQLRFVSNWIGASVSRCRLYVAEVDESGEAGDEATSPDVRQLAAGPLGSGPAKDEALRLLGINLYIPGECYIIAQADAGPSGEDLWFVVSDRQIRRAGNQVIVRRSLLHGGGDMLFRPDQDLILRVWTPHPADTDEPDSPTRSSIPYLREIEAIMKREYAELDSRLAGAGLLPLPQELEFPRGESDDTPAGVDGLMRRLGRAMSTSLVDRASAEAMVPIMFTVPMEALDKIKPVTFWSDLSAELLPMRQAAVVSLAQSLDVPPEILLGQAASNHWTAWQTSEDAITTQIVPVLSRIADALTTGYLRDALEQMGEDPDGYVYAFDITPLTVRPNRSADALNYHKEGLISDAAARDAGAFRDDEKPNDAERLRRLVTAAVESTPALLGDARVWEILGGTGAPPATATPSPALPEAPSEPNNPTPPQPPPRALPAPQPQTEQPAAAALLAVSAMAVRRALALASGRLVRHTQRDRYPDTPRHELHTRVAPVSTERAEELLRGAWDDLPCAADELGLDRGQLQRLLHGFALELLTRGIAYQQPLLRDLIDAAIRGQHLRAAPAVAA